MSLSSFALLDPNVWYDLETYSVWDSFFWHKMFPLMDVAAAHLLAKPEQGYNCASWALGINEWIDLPLAGDRPSPQQQLQQFIASIALQYPATHPQNVYNIVKAIKVISCNETLATQILWPSDNAVVFYYHKGALEHMARYITNLEGSPVHSWTSKLGRGELIAHSLLDLQSTAKRDLYGLPLCYAEIVAT